MMHNPAVHGSLCLIKAAPALAVLFCGVLYNQIQKGCVRPGCLALLVPYHWRPTPLHPKGPPPMGPTLEGVGGWEGPTGSSQQLVPGNSGLSSDGWNLKNNQKESPGWW